MVTAGEVMLSPVPVIAADASIAEAWQVLYGTGLTHVLVVVHGQCVGVIDDRVVALEWPVGAFESHRRTVGAVIGGPARTVSVETSVIEVAELMVADSVDAVPVVSGTGRPLGLVRAADITALVARVGLGEPAAPAAS